MATYICTRPAKAADSSIGAEVKRRATYGRSAFFLSYLLFLTAPAAAQQTTIEIFGGTQSLSGPYGDGGSIGLRVRHEQVSDVWYVGVHRESRFDDDGFIASIANTHVINQDWYSYLGVAGSTDAVFLPRYRVDGQLARKFGSEREWVATVSAAASAAHDEHRDLGAGVGLIRYFSSGLVIDGSVFWNRSNPGAVIARRQNLAITYLRRLRYQASARVSFGEEAYQITGVGPTLVNFDSKEIAVRWQHWLSTNAGVSAGVEYYDNPFYSRTGITFSIFRQFGP